MGKNRSFLNRSAFQTHAALIYVQVTFGVFHVIAKVILQHFDPLVVANFRVLCATPLLLFFAWKLERTIPSIRDMGRLALLGFLGVFANQLLFIVGLNHTTATNAGILMPSIPVLTVATAVLMKVETLSFKKLFGVLCCSLGAVVMLDIRHLSLHDGMAFGNALILINCLSYSVFLVLQLPILKRLPPFTVIAWAFLFGSIGVLFVGGYKLLTFNPSSIPVSAWIGIIYIVIFPTALNYFLNTWAIRRSSPSLVAAYSVLQPVVATSIAVIFLHEVAGFRELLGFGLIIAGLLFVSRVTPNQEPVLVGESIIKEHG